jgi:hypothetical protein
VFVDRVLCHAADHIDTAAAAAAVAMHKPQLCQLCSVTRPLTRHVAGDNVGPGGLGTQLKAPHQRRPRTVASKLQQQAQQQRVMNASQQPASCKVRLLWQLQGSTASSGTSASMHAYARLRADVYSPPIGNTFECICAQLHCKGSSVSAARLTFTQTAVPTGSALLLTARTSCSTHCRWPPAQQVVMAWIAAVCVTFSKFSNAVTKVAAASACALLAFHDRQCGYNSTAVECVTC